MKTLRRTLRTIAAGGSLTMLLLAGSIDARPPSAPQAKPEAELEVVVHGNKAPDTYARREASLASTVVTEAKLRSPGAELSDVLRGVVGVQTTRTGSQADLATASIRGADARQVPVYLAGVRLNDEVSGTADLSTVPVHILERIEVFRGNAPRDATRMGIGGAILLHPRKPKGMGFGTGIELGSFGSQKYSFDASVGTHRASSLASISQEGAHNRFPFLNDHGQRFSGEPEITRRRNADYSQTDAWAIGQFRPRRHTQVSLVMNAFRRAQGMPGQPSAGVDHARATSQRELVGLSTQTPCAPRGRCKLSLTTSWISATSTVLDPRLELRRLNTPILNNQGQRFEQVAHLQASPTEDLELFSSLGFALASTRVNRLGNLPYHGRRRSSIVKLGTALHPTERMVVHALAALECHGTSGSTVRFNQLETTSSPPCGLLAPTGRVGAQLILTEELQLLANLSRSVRLPNLSEVYGVSAFVEGNPQLKPESAVSIDFGARVNWKGLGNWGFTAESFLFGRQVNEMIRYRRSSLQGVSPFNVARARVLGAELSVTLTAFKHLEVSSATTVLDPKETTSDPALDPTTNDILPFTARLLTANTLRVYDSFVDGWLQCSQLSSQLTYLHKSSRFGDSAGLVVLPQQDLVDWELSSGHFDDFLTAKLRVQNIFDQNTQDLIGLPVPGRSVFASLEARY